MSKVSAGEIIAGMYVTVLEIEYPQKYTCQLTGATLEETILDKLPWIRGIPFKVIYVMGPMVAVYTRGIHKELPKVTVLDSRYYRFLEVTKEYYEEYGEMMRKLPRKPKILAGVNKKCALNPKIQ